jgi:methyl-accepting chemotaxis protein
MDKVVQRNVTESEESASAAEQLSSQAAEMKKMLIALTTLLEGVKNSSRNQAHEKAHPFRQNQRDGRMQKTFRANRKTRSLSSRLSRETVERPKAIIPFDEDEFKDF